MTEFVNSDASSDDAFYQEAEYPDVLGLPYDEAASILKLKGISFHAVEISSYGRDKVEDGISRVIRQDNPSIRAERDDINDEPSSVGLVISRVRDIDI